MGDVAVGTVQSVQLYGAFLELEDNTVGLLHISQISHDRVANVADVLSMGDKIKVRTGGLTIQMNRNICLTLCTLLMPDFLAITDFGIA